MFALILGLKNSSSQIYCRIQYSVDNPYSQGCEAVYDTLDNLGFNVSKYRYDSTYLYNVRNKVIVSIDNGELLDSVELDSWIKKGNTAIVLTGDTDVDEKSYKLYKSYKGYRFYKSGKGNLVYNSNPDILTNKNIKKRVFDFVSVIQKTGKKDIVFDEYGKTDMLQQNVWDVMPLWLQLVCVQLIIVGLGFIVFYLKRFGRLKNVSEDNVRNVKEYYQAASNLYESAHDYPSMIKEYYANFEHCVREKYGYGLKGSNEELIELWKIRGLGNIDILTEIVTFIEKIDKVNITEKMFAEFIGKIDILKREVNI